MTEPSSLAGRGDVWGPWNLNHPTRRVPLPRATGRMDYELITSPKNLVDVCRWLRTHNSDAPGPDGVRLSQLSNKETWALMRALSDCLCDGTYRPGQSREVPVPKRTGGHRIIRIRGLFDRIVSAAIDFALNSVIDPHFLPMSHCSRPGRGCTTMLAMMYCVIQQTGHPWLVNADVYHAFDEVPRALATNSFRPFITCPDLMSLIEVVLRGEGVQPVGIDQGAALSPLAFNTTMHSLFDCAMSPRRLPLEYRYLDNLVAHCASEMEAHLRLQEFAHVLSHGSLNLKEPTREEPVIIDLRSTSTVLLGFELSIRDGLLQLAIAERTWANLGDNLRDAYRRRSSPTARASQLCRSWCDYYALGLLDPDAAVHRIFTILRSCGIREGVTQDMLHDAITQAHQSWADLLAHTATLYLSDAPTEGQRSTLHLSGPLLPAETESPPMAPASAGPADTGAIAAHAFAVEQFFLHVVEVPPASARP